MQVHVNPLLMNAHALPVDINEPHAQAGNHLRVSTHPLLGLPVTPFVVYRATTGSRKSLIKRNTAIYIDDATQQRLLPPFSMRSGQSVTVTIARAAREQCIWVDLLARPDTTGTGGIGRPVPIDRPDFPTLPPSVLRPPDFGAGRDLRLPVVRQVSGFQVLAYMASASGRGPAIVGRRSAMPFAFSAPDIVQLRVQGAGQVFGIEWIEAHESQKLEYEPYTVMCLPHKGGPRYLPINAPIALAAAHTAEQAPKRLPLQETIGTPAPAASPVATIAQELQRVASLVGKLDDDLESLLVDTSESQLEQMVTDVVTDANGTVLTDVDGNPAGSSSTARLQRVLSALADPGTATGFGYKLCDDQHVEVEDRINFYRVYGFFEDIGTAAMTKAGVDISLQQVFDATLGAVSANNRQLDTDDVMQRYRKLVGQLPVGQPVGALSPAATGAPQRYVMLQTHAVADRLAPLDQPEALRITDAVHKNWLPGPPPDAPREVELQLAGVRLGGLLAGAKREPSATGSPVSMNRKNDEGFHLPVILASNIDDETAEPVNEPGIGFIADRSAAASAIDYAVAQQDRFGRWSEWSRTVADAGTRPRPPKPVLQAYYTQPNINDAASQGGRITVFVAVPDALDLAPGSLALKHVRVFIADPQSVDQQHDLVETSKVAVPEQPGSFRVELRVNGPRLALLEQRRIIVSAIWFDTDDRQSVRSENVRLNLVDPRPPLQPTVPPFLLYSARPDVTGLAWIEHRWPGQAGVTHGVYYSDENRLQRFLEETNNISLLTQLSMAETAAIRAGVYRENASDFPDYLFERLDNVMVEFTGTQVGFRHAVSGSLRVLSVYKIAAESASGAKPVLTDLPIVVFGVPNSDPPQQPVLSVKPATSGIDESDYVVDVEISALDGTTEAVNWRLRRTRTDTQKLSAMPVVAIDSFNDSESQTDRQVASYRDNGAVLIAGDTRLAPWVRYTYRVEVQGAPESGSLPPVPGRWSVASEPVTLELVPERAPLPPVLDSLSGTAVQGGLRNVSLTLTHPQRLSGGTRGYYSVRIERRLPGGVLETLGIHDIVKPDEPLQFTGVDAANPDEVVPVNTTYIVTLSDPIGRNAVPLSVPAR